MSLVFVDSRHDDDDFLKKVKPAVVVMKSKLTLLID